MKDWTDDELGALLTEVFVAHEQYADTNVAARVIATASPARYRWPAFAFAAAASTVAVVVAIAVLISPRGDTGLPTTRPTPTASVRTGTDAEYQAEALHEGLRILSLARVPPGAVRLSGAPQGWPVAGNVPFGIADRRLAKSSWFSTSLTADQVERYLLSHPPAGFAKTMPGLARRSSGLRYFAFDKEIQTDPAVLVFSRLLVEWHQQGDRTTLRFETMMLSRRARTLESVITGKVTDIDVDRVRRNVNSNYLDTKMLPRVIVTNPRLIARLVADTNALYGSDDPVVTAFCPFPGDPAPGTTLTFHSTVAVWTFSWQSGCVGQVAIARNGQQLDLTLNPSNLEGTVDQLLGR